MATLTVDDNDPRIQYAGGLWEVLRGSSQQYRSTVHSTWDFNATATFSFNGVGVRVYATIPSGKGTSTVAYSLSQGSSLTVWQPSGSTTMYGREVFYSGALPLGQHTLVMANMGEDNDMDFQLDRIVVELGGSGSSSTSSQAATTQTLTSSSSSSSATQMANATSSAPDAGSASRAPISSSLLSSFTQGAPITNPTSSSSGPDSTLSGSSGTSTPSSSVPKIVGSVIGAVALLLFILFFILLRVKQSKRKRAWSKQIDETPTPFYPRQQIPPLHATSELAPTNNLTRSGTLFSTHLPTSSTNATFMGTDPFSRDGPSDLPLPSLLAPPEKSPLDLPQPSLAIATSPSRSVNPTTPSSFYPASIPTTDDDRPPSYHPESR